MRITMIVFLSAHSFVSFALFTCWRDVLGSRPARERVRRRYQPGTSTCILCRARIPLLRQICSLFLFFNFFFFDNQQPRAVRQSVTRAAPIGDAQLRPVQRELHARYAR
ncbi:hypothetical protein BJY52DRAFT_1289625 [Lactarius psammicola]|nr:hypothetical protein BJY52DRAFT_1289625 [Lactarius psammicola]